MKNKILRMAGLLITGIGMCWGQEAAQDSTPALGFKSSGYVYYENYRLWKADYSGNIYKGDWFNDVLGGFVLENNMSPRLKTRVALEATFNRPFPEQFNQDASLTTSPSAYVQEAKAIYSFGDVQNPPVELEVGYFIYDYNRDQHNLGEYLFRSGIYPLILNTSFELPAEKLLGFRLGNKPFEGFHQDLLLTSDYKYFPKSDFSLSYVADYSAGKVLTLGAGISLVNVFPVRPSLEAPHSDNNTYIQIPAQTWTDANGVQHQISAPINIFKTDLNTMQNADSISYVNPTTFSRDIDPQIQHTTTYFTSQGVKLMGRFTLDPKPLMGSPAWLGPDDMKLYSEVAVLGVKDYPFLYGDIWQRIPVMVGFDFPAFHLLDVLGLEVEYCGNQWPNDWQKLLREGLPQPGDQNFSYSNYDPADYANDHWKWSIYLRKELSHGLFVSAQMASDHLRLADQNGWTYESLMKDTGWPFTREWWGIVRITAKY